jgi:peptide deformylase
LKPTNIKKLTGITLQFAKGIIETCKRYRGVGIANRGVGISNRV